MYTSNLPEVDLIIRPSGEKKAVKFSFYGRRHMLSFGTVIYAGLIFTNKDMEQAIIDYQNRDRRFGRI